MLEEKKVTVYEHEETIVDETTGQIISTSRKTINKVSAEPDYIKVYYETMLSFNQIHDIPVSFVLSMSKFLEWSNEGSPLCVTLNRRIKTIMEKDCDVSIAQIDRYIRRSVENGLLFRTEFRGVYEVNPFMIAKGKWESIKQLRTSFDFIGGKWTRTIIQDTGDEPKEE